MPSLTAYCCISLSADFSSFSSYMCIEELKRMVMKFENSPDLTAAIIHSLHSVIIVVIMLYANNLCKNARSARCLNNITVINL
jgi:hypothetical protein